MAELKYIVSGTYDEYKRYLTRKISEGHDSSVYRYVDSVNKLRGLRECHGYFIGTYQQRPDIDEIRDAIRIVNNTRAPQTITNTVDSIVAATDLDTPKLGDLKLHDGKFYAWYGDYDGWRVVSAVEREAYRELRAGQNPS